MEKKGEILVYENQDGKIKVDVRLEDEKTIMFFKIVQNKLLWAISRQTAAELVYRRVDAHLPLLGMQSFDKDQPSKIRKADVKSVYNVE